MEIDLQTMSKEELTKLITEAQKALKSLDTRRKAEAKLAAEKVAQEFGFSLDEVVASGGKSSGGGSKSAPKYAHPDNPALTWTGRGRKPNWIVEGLKNGKSLDDFAI